MEGDRSSTWTGDHARHSLPFLLLNFLELIDTIDENAEAALVAAARKELAYLEQFGRPLLPFQREREGGLRVQGAVTVGPHQESRTLPSHRILARLQELSPPSFLYPPSRSPAEQHHRVDIVRL